MSSLQAGQVLAEHLQGPTTTQHSSMPPGLPEGRCRPRHVHVPIWRPIGSDTQQVPVQWAWVLDEGREGVRCGRVDGWLDRQTVTEGSRWEMSLERWGCPTKNSPRKPQGPLTGLQLGPMGTSPWNSALPDPILTAALEPAPWLSEGSTCEEVCPQPLP